jgi:hypothetical protein
MGFCYQHRAAIVCHLRSLIAARCADPAKLWRPAADFPSAPREAQMMLQPSNALLATPRFSGQNAWFVHPLFTPTEDVA